jgi:hypothetical protein
VNDERPGNKQAGAFLARSSPATNPLDATGVCASARGALVRRSRFLSANSIDGRAQRVRRGVRGDSACGGSGDGGGATQPAILVPRVRLERGDCN